MLIRVLVFGCVMLLACSKTGVAQELLMDVQVTIPALKVADPKTLQTLEGAIREFYNNTQWTDDEYRDDEKIEGTIQINIKDDPSANTFKADIYINTGRPVYNSSYATPIMNHVDKDVSFRYEELTPIRDSRSVYSDNLSAVLTYYAYVILGFDGDTFAPLGGEDHFRVANQILNIVPPNAGANWTRSGGERNRFWLMENILDPRIRRCRQATYEYHRNGLDRMEKDVSTGKQQYRNSMVIQMWANSKRQEILEVFKNSVKSEQRQVYSIMADVDPGQLEELKELR